jgi:hypothetical protein
MLTLASPSWKHASMRSHLPLSRITPQHRLNPVWTNAPLLNHASPIAHRTPRLTTSPENHPMTLPPTRDAYTTFRECNAWFNILTPGDPAIPQQACSRSPVPNPYKPSCQPPPPLRQTTIPETFDCGATEEDDHCGTNRDGDGHWQPTDLVNHGDSMGGNNCHGSGQGDACCIVGGTIVSP